MADDTLAEQLRHVAGMATRSYDRLSSKTIGLIVDAILADLDERGRLVPDGATVREIPGVRLTWPDGRVEEFQQVGPGVAERAVAHHRRLIAAGESALTSAERLRRRQINTPWEPVPATPEGQA